MPEPKANEEKREYLNRCMGDMQMYHKYPERAQRYAVCNSLWENKGDEKSDREKQKD